MKTFSVLIRQGSLQRHTLGRYPLLSLANARRDALDLMRHVAEHGQQVPEKPVTLAELVDQYVELHLTPNVRQWKNVRSSLLQTAMQPLLSQEAAKVSNIGVVAVLDSIVAAGKPHGAVNLLKALRALYNWAEARGAVPANPCRNIRPPVRTTQRDRILDDAEIAAVLGACDAVKAPFGDMVRMLLFTGARRNEVAHMRWSELNGNVWTLPAARSKSGRANMLPLPPAAMALLNKLPRHSDDGYIFTTTEGRRPSSAFAQNKRALDAASGTNGWTLHDLRRSARSRMSELGVPWEVARRVVGHSVDQLDAVYDRFSYLDEKGRALEQLADHYEKASAQNLNAVISFRSTTYFRDLFVLMPLGKGAIGTSSAIEGTDLLNCVTPEMIPSVGIAPATIWRRRPGVTTSSQGIDQQESTWINRPYSLTMRMTKTGRFRLLGGQPCLALAAAALFSLR